jgi:hypothetical protein
MFFNGRLLISPSQGEAALTLTVTQTAANTFSVTDNGATLGTFTPVSDLRITGGTGNNTVTVDTNGLVYSGSVSVATGGGNDTVNLDAGASTGGTISGAVFLQDAGGDNSATIGNGNGVTPRPGQPGRPRLQHRPVGRRPE